MDSSFIVWNNAAFNLSHVEKFQLLENKEEKKYVLAIYTLNEIIETECIDQEDIEEPIDFLLQFINNVASFTYNRVFNLITEVEVALKEIKEKN